MAQSRKDGKMNGGAVGAMIAAMVVTGTLNTLATKVQFTMTSVGKAGNVEVFSKPWFGTFNMMFAMFIVGVCDKLWRLWSERGRDAPRSVPLLVDEAPPTAQPGTGSEVPYWSKVAMVSVPGAFDILATALTNTGVLYLPASVWQMLRGSSIIFAAGLSILCLKRKMYAFNWLGLFLCVAGISLVGVAQVMGSAEVSSSTPTSSHDANFVLFGICIVLAGQVVQAGQLVGEEFIMKKVDFPPMQIIGWEGALGTAMMLVIVYPLLWLLPGSDGGHAEDIVDTITMIRNNSHLLLAVLVFLFSCATFNAAGISVTAHLSSVHRMMLDASRTILIWAFGLAVHWYDPECAFGERWTNWSAVQLFGFAMLVTGQAVYGEVLRVPGWHYPKSMPASNSSPSAALRLSSPLPREAREEL